MVTKIMTNPTSDPDRSPEEAIDTITFLPHPPSEGSNIPPNEQNLGATKRTVHLGRKEGARVWLPEKADPQANCSPATLPNYMSLGGFTSRPSFSLFVTRASSTLQDEDFVKCSNVCKGPSRRFGSQQTLNE